MAINWQELATSVFTTTACVGAVAWVARSLITHWLTRNATAFESKLKADVGREMESFRNSFQIIAAEQQIRFSNLHQKRAEIVAELYKRLAQVEREANYFVGQLGEERNNEGPNMLERLWDFINFVDENQIYFPNLISVLLESYYSELQRHVVHAHVYGKNKEKLSYQAMLKMNEGFENAFKAFSEQIPTLRLTLRQEFRAILGVN
jgi:hypothetical protein